MASKKTVGWRVRDALGNCAFHVRGDFGPVLMDAEGDIYTFRCRDDAMETLRLLRYDTYEHAPFRLVRVVRNHV